MKLARLVSLLALVLCAALHPLRAQTPETPKPAATPAVPDWALPGSATHRQVAPPPDFRRASTHFAVSLGPFEGQSDIGSAAVPGGASYDAGTKQFTITSAGYNVWYTRDEFRYLRKKMSGDVSLAADIAYPDPNGFGDRKAVLVIRQDLDDDSKEAIVALHGLGMIHLAQRPEKGARVRDMEGRGRSETAPLRTSPARRRALQLGGTTSLLCQGFRRRRAYGGQVGAPAASSENDSASRRR